MKALARQLRGFRAQLREVSLTFEMLVADLERAYGDGGARSNTSHQTLLDYA